MKLRLLSKPVLGIGVEVLYTLTIMLAVFIVCLALSLPR
jgi:hypothetical protein